MRKFASIIFNIYIYAGALFLVVLTISVAMFLVDKGLLSLEKVDGSNNAFVTFVNIVKDIWPAVVGTTCITFSAIVIAAPAGILSGIFINEYTDGTSKQFFIFLFKILAGLPSIVVGVLGFMSLLIVNNFFNLSLQTSFLVSSLTLALLVLPYIVHSTVMALKQIPVQTRIAALSLGAKRYQNIFRVLLPESFQSLSSGVILAIGRACEDTAVIMLTGAAAYAGLPSSLLNSYEALPFYIYYHTSEYQDQYELTGVFVATIAMVLISVLFIVLAGHLNQKIHVKLNH